MHLLLSSSHFWRLCAPACFPMPGLLLPGSLCVVCCCRLLRIEILLTVATFALAIYNLVAGESMSNHLNIVDTRRCCTVLQAAAAPCSHGGVCVVGVEHAHAQAAGQSGSQHSVRLAPSRRLLDRQLLLLMRAGILGENLQLPAAWTEDLRGFIVINITTLSVCVATFLWMWRVMARKKLI